MDHVCSAVSGFGSAGKFSQRLFLCSTFFDAKKVESIPVRTAGRSPALLSEWVRSHDTMIAMVELPYTLTDSVLPGDGIGKKMGVPTLNIDTSWIDRSLAHGVYAGVVILPDGSQHLAAIHYGPRPAFHDLSLRLEAHLLDVALPKTPKEVTVMLVSFLREIRDFPDTKALKKAIQDDIKKTRAIMAAHA